MRDGMQMSRLHSASSHYPLMDALNAAPMCNNVCDVVTVGNTEMYECKL